MTRAGVLGGTFDPPHLGHLVLAAAARRALALDRVLFVPAGDPWRKTGGAAVGRGAVSPPEARLALTRAAVGGLLPWAEVSDAEVRRAGPSYTAETLERLRAADPGAEWWFLLGRDALADLPHWRDPGRILALARLGLARRGGAGEPLPGEAAAALPGLAARVDSVPMPRLGVSASALRRRVAAGGERGRVLPGGGADAAGGGAPPLRRTRPLPGRLTASAARRAEVEREPHPRAAGVGPVAHRGQLAEPRREAAVVREQRVEFGVAGADRGGGGAAGRGERGRVLPRAVERLAVHVLLGVAVGVAQQRTQRRPVRALDAARGQRQLVPRPEAQRERPRREVQHHRRIAPEPQRTRLAAVELHDEARRGGSGRAAADG